MKDYFILFFIHVCLFGTNLQAQPIGWTTKTPFTVTENKGVLIKDYQVRLVVNTQALVTAGSMQANGQDIRFAKDCIGNLPLSYWIDMPTMNTTATNIWVKLDSLPANSTRTFYFFYGNASAAPLSNINTFSGPHSTTDSISGGPISGTNVSNSQRGFRFSPKEDILIKSMGRREPNGTTRYITLFDATTQAILQQLQVSGSASSYHYADLVTPAWLTANTYYVLTQFQGVGDQYYYQDAQAGTHINYMEMRSKNLCTQNSFPTSTTAGKMYGHPDMLYYVKKNVTPAPTVTMNASNADVIATPLADIYKCNNMSVTKIGNPTFTSGRAPFSFSWTPTASLVNPLTASPLSDANIPTTYTAYITDNYGCKGTISQELKISLPPSNVASGGTGNCTNTLVQACDPINGNTWVNFSDNTGQIIASLQPNGNNLGRVSITLYNNSLSSVDMTANSNQNGILWNYGNKTWLITADSTPTTPVGVRFYYNSTELDALKNASGCMLCTDEDILLVRSSFATAGMEDCDAFNNSAATYYIYWNKNGNSASYVTPYLQNDIAGVTVAGYYGNVAAGNNGYAQSNQTAYSGKYFEVWTNGFSEFRMNMRNNGIFPITLQDFTGNNQAHVNHLKWISSQEINSSHYEVERSSNKQDFLNIGEIKAAGNSGVAQTYSFADMQSPAGKSFYRLKMIDIDGTFAYSSVVELSNVEMERASVSFTPNPAKDKLYIQIYSPHEGNITYNLSDMTGKAIFSEVIKATAGNNAYNIALPSLATGFYQLGFYMLEGNIIHQKVFIKQ